MHLTYMQLIGVVCDIVTFKNGSDLKLVHTFTNWYVLYKQK